MKEEKFQVTGMSCSACSSRVEKVVSEMADVSEVSVNLLTGTMKVKFDDEKISEQDIIGTVIKAGYGASVAGKKTASKPAEDTTVPTVEKMRRRLVASGVLLVLLIAASMMGKKEAPMTTALVQILLLIPIVLLNNRFFVKGLPGMFRGSFNMDTLVALGAGSSILYGLFSVFMMAKGYQTGDLALVHMYYRPMYFQSAGTILTLISIGKYLETKSKGKTSEAIRALVQLAPDTAVILKDGKEVQIDASDLEKGDILLVRPGERFAADGKILEGRTNVDESAITGESMPVEKQTGDSVISATINKTGFVKVCCDKTGEDTTLSQIIALVEEASSSKAPIARLADKIAGIFVPTVISVAVITTLVWLFMGKTFSFALYMGITVLVISCPCALGLATPVAIMVGTGKGAKEGVLIKSGEAFQTASAIDTVVLDKTGTVTTGHPAVTDVLLYKNQKKVFEQAYKELARPEAELVEFLSDVSALERGSEHPLAEACLAFAEKAPVSVREAKDFEARPGEGVTGQVGEKNLGAGNRALAKKLAGDISFIQDDYARLSGEGKTPLIIVRDGDVSGIIAVADQVKESSQKAIQKFVSMGIDVLMLTGDNEGTAKAVGKRVGIDKVIANVYPGDKERVIRELKDKGHKVAMIGDGINDAPALVRADVGIAIGAGTDVAIESADIVLMHSDLLDAVTAVKLSKAVLRNIKQNLGWAFGYNTILIPLASGLFFPAFGIRLNPMIGALMMSLSSFIVVSNALRLRFFKGEKPDAQKEKTFLKTLHVEGMMCEKCEQHVTEALKTLPGVLDVKADHKQGLVTLKTGSTVNQDAMTEVIRKAGYEVMDNTAEKILKVEGMMCEKCEMHVEKALKDLEGVVSAKADHVKGEVRVKVREAVAKEKMEKAIIEAGYDLPKEKTQTYTLDVTGMMCPKCEMHVKKDVEALPGVLSCQASHKEGKVQVEVNRAGLLPEIEKVIEAAGYTVR